jgi:hypothetical protein
MNVKLKNQACPIYPSVSFFQFHENNSDSDFRNPCELPMLRKLFRPAAGARREIVEKETVDEIIFGTDNDRNRLMPELMARGGIKGGDMLKMDTQ